MFTPSPCHTLSTASAPLPQGRKGQASHGWVEADAASQSEIGSLSDLQFVVHADSKAPEKTAASAGPSQGDLSRSRSAAGVGPRCTRRVQREMSGRTAPVACGPEMNGRNGRLRCRCRPRFKFASSRRTASQVCHASHIQPFGNFGAAALDWRRRNGRTIDRFAVCPAGPAGSRRYSPAGRELRPAPPRSPPFPCDRAAPCNRPEGNSCPARIRAAPPRDKNPTDADPRSGTATATLPDRLTRTTRHAAITGRFELSRLALAVNMLRTHVDRRMLARLGDLRDPRGHRVQIDVRRDGQERFVIEYRHAFEPSLEESTTSIVLPIGQPRQRFFQAFHEPTDALQSLASRRHPLRVIEPPLNPMIRNSQRLPGLIARWKQPSPTSHDLLVRPTIGDRLV